MRRLHFSRNRWRPLLGALAVALPTLAGCKGDDGPRGPAGPQGPPGTALPEPGDGLVLTIESVEIGADRRPVAIFRLEDGDGAPMALASLDGDPRFVIGHLDVDATSGLTRLRSAVVNEVEGRSYTRDGMLMAPALASAEQAGTDSGGEFTVIDDGEYRYTFGTQLPEGYDTSATHIVAVFASRLGRSLVANDVYRFVPAGGEPSTHEVVTNDACNECHGTISAHGGVRQALGLCAVCHTDQTFDPETGASLELSHMIHRIHAGSTLAEPYVVVGFNQSIHDYSHVVYPGQLLSCEKCHKGADSERWRTAPSRSACSGCHDDVNFETGENHAEGLQQFDDSLCNRCHREEMVLEFDRTVPGAHVIPYESSANPRLEIAIIDVENMTPGAQPSIRFTVTDDAGPVDIATLDRVALLFAGSTNDYSQAITPNTVTVHGGGAAGMLVENAVGDYTFTPDAYTLPADASGTWSVGMEARTVAFDVNGSSIRFGANNPVVHVDTADGTLGGGNPEPRRQIVDEAKCNACHHDIIFHGNLRTDTSYCVLCHNTRATDEPRRPNVDAETNPPASIDFDFLIHRIHRGEDLTEDYIVYGFGNTPHEWSHVVFPNDLANCSVCHVNNSHLLPLPADSEATVVHIGGVPVPGAGAIRPPTTGACTGCHDDPATLTHARLESFVDGPDDWSEACSVCHGEGSSLAVSLVHDR